MKDKDKVVVAYLTPNAVVWALLSIGEKVKKDDYLAVGKNGELIFLNSITDMQAFEPADNLNGKEPIRIKVVFQKDGENGNDEEEKNA